MSDRVERYFINDQGEEMCWCPGCDGYKLCGEFTVNRTSNTGFNYKCKVCLKQEKLRRDRGIYTPLESDEELKKILLTRLGYDLECGIPVHKQLEQRILEKKINDRLRKRTQ